MQVLTQKLQRPGWTARLRASCSEVCCATQSWSHGLAHWESNLAPLLHCPAWTRAVATSSIRAVQRNDSGFISRRAGIQHRKHIP